MSDYDNPLMRGARYADTYTYPMTDNPQAVPGGELRNSPPGTILNTKDRLWDLAAYLALPANFLVGGGMGRPPPGMQPYDVAMANRLMRMPQSAPAVTGGDPGIAGRYGSVQPSKPYSFDSPEFANSAGGLSRQQAGIGKATGGMRRGNFSHADMVPPRANAADTKPLTAAEQQYLDAMLTQQLRGQLRPVE